MYKVSAPNLYPFYLTKTMPLAQCVRIYFVYFAKILFYEKGRNRWQLTN